METFASVADDSPSVGSAKVLAPDNFDAEAQIGRDFKKPSGDYYVG